VWLKVTNDGRQIVYKFANEWHILVRLQSDEFSFALVGDFEECIAGHVLYTWMNFVHKFEELVDYRLEEFPMSLEEARILPHHIHDIRCYDCLVVFTPFLFAEPQ
jgi:hypothetical protein